MSWTGSRFTLENRRGRRPETAQRKRRPSPGRTPHRPMRQLEWLEDRSLLSSVPLSGFPAGGFRSSVLDGTPPWSVSVLIDGQPTIAIGYDESTELMSDAPALDLSGADPLWIAGIIGDTRLRGSGVATNEVDLYRLDLPYGDRYALSLRALAQGLGSSLDPALSLFDSVGQLLAANDDILHADADSISDSELYAGLQGGTYFIAVSAGGNLPSELGGFNPLVPGSGTASRGTRGQYLLQVKAVVDNERPEVVGISLEPGSTVSTHLSEITVRFSEPMDLHGLYAAALLGPDGLSIDLGPVSYHSDTFEVTYRLNERPVPGNYVFTLSAAEVTDRAQNPISGDGWDGGFALPFRLEPPPQNRVDTESNDTLETAQDLGPLYRNELRSTVSITGSVHTSGDQDFYRFHVNRLSFFTIRLRPAAGTSQTGLIMIRSGEGQLMGQGFRFPGLGSMLIRLLQPGDYVLQMNGDLVRPGAYTLSIHAAADIEIPLLDNSVGPSVSAVLATRDGERAAINREATATSTPIIVTTDAMAYSVGSVPTVASQPVGRPQTPTAGATELVWVDMSSGRRVLPDGIALGRSDDTPTSFSVASVSGSFLEPLPESVFDGATDSDNPRQLGTDLRVAMDIVWQNESSRAADDGLARPDSSEQYASYTDHASSDDSATRQDSGSSPGLAFGMMASLGAVGAATAKNRRRPTTWIQSAFDYLGIEA